MSDYRKLALPILAFIVFIFTCAIANAYTITNTSVKLRPNEFVAIRGDVMLPAVCGVNAVKVGVRDQKTGRKNSGRVCTANRFEKFTVRGRLVAKVFLKNDGDIRIRVSNRSNKKRRAQIVAYQ